MVLNGERIGGIYRLMGQQQESINQAEIGEIVAISRLEKAQTGDSLTNCPPTKPFKPLPQAEKFLPSMLWQSRPKTVKMK